MDMKQILQALDGASTKPVEGASAMSKFLRIVSEASINQIPPMPDVSDLQPGASKEGNPGEKITKNTDGTVSYQGGWGTYVYDAQGKHIKTQSPSMAGYSQETDPSGNVTQQNYNQGPLSIQKGPQGTTANYQLGTQNLSTQLNEGANPHKVSLPVQMAMQHYQQPKVQLETESCIPTSIKRYFTEVEKHQQTANAERKQLLRQYASTIAERVLVKESKSNSVDVSAKRAAIKDLLDKDIYNKANQKDLKDYDKKYKKPAYLQKEQVNENEIPDHSMGFTGGVGPGLQSNVAEAPLDFDRDNPTSSTIHSHQGVNPASIEARIMRARGQLQELAAKAKHNDLIVWESIANHFPELAMNIEQIRHGIEELRKIKSQGGVRSRNIDVGESNPIKEANSKKKTLKNSNPCWKGYHPVGTKKKNGHTVPNCVPGQSDK